MWRPSTSNGSCVGSALAARPRAPKSSRCKVLRDHAVRAGAGPGRAAAARPARRRRTRCRPARASGAQQAAHAAQQVGGTALRRRGAECWLIRGVAQKLFEDHRRRRRVGIGRAFAPAPRRGVALVDLVHRQLEAAAQLAREAARAARIVVLGAVGVERHADHQRVGLPFGDQRCRSAAKRASPSARDGASAACAARLRRVADGDADALRCRNRKRGRSGRVPRSAAGPLAGTRVAKRRGRPAPAARGRGPRGGALMRARPPGSACADRCPAATAPGRSAARPACRR